MMTGLTVVIAIVLLASNFTIINAQQQFSSQQSGEIENRRTASATASTAPGPTFQSTNGSFSVQVPEGWIIHDFNNTGVTSLEESRQGYVMLAQLCPEEEQRRIVSNASGSKDSGSSTSNGCEGAQEVIHIIRYSDLNARLSANNITTINNNTTTDNILLYHLQKLQQVGYRDIEIVNSIERTVNLTNAQSNQAVTKVPAMFVEMTYSTASAPSETREGYFILTATNATQPNVGITKGYSVFYEGGNSVTATTAEITTTSGTLIPSLSPSVGQVFDSFELIASPLAEQPVAQQTQAAEATTTTEDEGDNDDDNGADDDNDDDDDDNGADDDNDDDDDDNGADDDNPEGGGEGGQPLGGGLLPRTAPEGEQGSEGGLSPPPPANDNGEGISPAEGEQGSENEFEDCIVPPRMDPGDVGC